MKIRTMELSKGNLMVAVLAAVLHSTTAVLIPTQNANLTFLGNLEGKSFFAEYGTRKNWTQARDTCLLSAMRLASITTSAQDEFLLNATNTETFPVDGYWTAGRDARNISRFAWDHEGENAIEFGITEVGFTTNVDRQACLHYYNNKDYDIRLYARICSNSYYVLCELPDPCSSE